MTVVLAGVDGNPPHKPILPEKFATKAVFSPVEVAEILGTSEWNTYELIRTGRIRGVKVGRLWRVPRHVLEQMLST